MKRKRNGPQEARCPRPKPANVARSRMPSIKPTDERGPGDDAPGEPHGPTGSPYGYGSRASWPADGCWAGRSSSWSASSSRSPEPRGGEAGAPTPQGVDQGIRARAGGAPHPVSQPRTPSSTAATGATSLVHEPGRGGSLLAALVERCRSPIGERATGAFNRRNRPATVISPFLHTCGCPCGNELTAESALPSTSYSNDEASP